MSGLLVLGAIVGIILAFDILVAEFGVDTRDDFVTRVGILS